MSRQLFNTLVGMGSRSHDFDDEHTVLQPFRRIQLIVHIATSVLLGTHFQLSQVKHMVGG